MKPEPLIIFTLDEAKDIIKKYLADGYHWIYEASSDYMPRLTDADMPILLIADKDKTLLHSIISTYKDRYFASPVFVTLYKKALRVKKLNKILNDQ